MHTHYSITQHANIALVTSEDDEDMEAAAAPLTAFTIQRTRNLALRKSQTKDHMSKTLHNRIMKKIRKECKDKVNAAR
jgi:hypothetical protein